jgi:hypothetical protein
MNLLSLVGPWLDNIYQIRRKWYYSSWWNFLQSKQSKQGHDSAGAERGSWLKKGPGRHALVTCRCAMTQRPEPKGVATGAVQKLVPVQATTLRFCTAPSPQQKKPAARPSPAATAHFGMSRMLCCRSLLPELRPSRRLPWPCLGHV